MHPYADDDARNRADRARRIGFALFKVVGRSPRPRQPGATGSNAYCLVQRCTGSKSLVPLPCSRAASLARIHLMEPARRHAQRLECLVVSCSSILTFTVRSLPAWHFRRNDGIPTKIMQTASSGKNVEL